MKRYMKALFGICAISFVLINIDLLFGERSHIPTSVYVNDYERMSKHDYEEQLTKPSIVTPLRVETIYFDHERAVDSWLVQVGNPVQVGSELATLRTGAIEQQRSLWVAEKEAIQLQKISVETSIKELKAEATRRNEPISNYGSEQLDDGQVNVTVDLSVEIPQKAVYNQAIAEAERDLAQLDRQLLFLEAQLAQSDVATAVLSPLDGVIAAVNRHAETPTIDIYTKEKSVVTFVTQEERKKIEVGDIVQIQADGIVHENEEEINSNASTNEVDNAVEEKWSAIFEDRSDQEIEQSEEEQSAPVEEEVEVLPPNIAKGTVVAISEVPATDPDVLKIYQSTQSEKQKAEPLYAVTFEIENELAQLAYSSRVNSFITVNEAKSAASVKATWVLGNEMTQTYIWKLTPKGKAVKVPVNAPFAIDKRFIVTTGIAAGDVVLDAEPFAHDRPARVFMPLPLDWPALEAWKATSWKSYIKYMLHTK